MLRADWLTHAITVPYVPALGPVHPAAISTDLFQAVVDLQPGRFLRYDKEQRWAAHKDETVLAGHTEHSAESTTFATLARRRGGRISVYHYAPTGPDLVASSEKVRKLAADHGVDAGRVVWFQHLLERGTDRWPDPRCHGKWPGGGRDRSNADPAGPDQGVPASPRHRLGYLPEWLVPAFIPPVNR